MAKAEGKLSEKELIERVIKEWFPEGEVKKVEKAPEEKEVEREEIKKELEELKAKIPKVSKKEVKKAVEEIKPEFPLNRKIEQLLILAHRRNLIFAIEVAKKIGDPLLWDLFHDILAKDKLYRKFLT